MNTGSRIETGKVFSESRRSFLSQLGTTISALAAGVLLLPETGCTPPGQESSGAPKGESMNEVGEKLPRVDLNKKRSGDNLQASDESPSGPHTFTVQSDGVSGESSP